MALVTLPHTLVAGTPENINDVQDNLNEIVNEINGSLDAANLATSAKPATLLGQYRTITEAGLQFADTDTAGTYYPTPASAVKSGVAIVTTTPIFFALTPADYAVSGLTTEFRVKGALGTNATASAINFTGALHPVTFSGAADAQVLTLGAAVSGSTFTRTAPAISSAFVDASSDFTLSTAGVYALGVTLSGTLAANSFATMNLRLEVRHV